MCVKKMLKKVKNFFCGWNTKFRLWF